MTWSRAFLCIAMLAISGCGFSIRKTDDTRFAAWGIQKIFVPAIRNDSSYAWLDAIVRNEWMKRLNTGGAVQTVSSIQNADSKLLVHVTEATRPGAAPTSTNQLSPSGTVRAGTQFFSMYSAHLVMRIELIQLRTPVATFKPSLPADTPASVSSPPSPTPPSTVKFQGTASRDLPFPSNTRVSYLGTTSALINQSETERAMTELTEQLVLDLYFQMKDAF